MNIREMKRAERGRWEHERMLRRYEMECGEVITYKLEKEELDGGTDSLQQEQDYG